MNETAKGNAPKELCKTDKEFFPSNDSALTKSRASTYYWKDFTLAEQSVLLQGNEALKKAIEDFFNGEFAKWKNEIKHLTELATIANHKGWQWWGINKVIAYHYFALYRRIYHYVYPDGDSSSFTDEDLAFFYQVTD